MNTQPHLPFTENFIVWRVNYKNDDPIDYFSFFGAFQFLDGVGGKLEIVQKEREIYFGK